MVGPALTIRKMWIQWNRKQLCWSHLYFDKESTKNMLDGGMNKWIPVSTRSSFFFSVLPELVGYQCGHSQLSTFPYLPMRVVEKWISRRIQFYSHGQMGNQKKLVITSFYPHWHPTYSGKTDQKYKTMTAGTKLLVIKQPKSKGRELGKPWC